ncbi:fibrous sheath-interacting protein 2 isoform X2 [Ascaphus truei]|uniref:fibrous sheath-interacting protein 2 isoform X2 n=1 Tax=Ascaphus truei TaxID=8439 RepID=UPI003F59EC1E
MDFYIANSSRPGLGGGNECGDGTYVQCLPAPPAKQLLEMPLGVKLPILPGSEVMLYTTHLAEKLHQPSPGFNLGDPQCSLLGTKYKNLHDPHLSSYYKRKDIQRTLKQGGYITNNNKIVCSLREFNQYRHYLTSIKLDFERNYMKEQKYLGQQLSKLDKKDLIPEGANIHLREWLLKEQKTNIRDRVSQGRSRYLDLLNSELEKIECLAEEKRRLCLTKQERRENEHCRKKILLRKKMEEDWKTKEMFLLLRIGKEIRREAKIEEQKRRAKEEMIRKRHMLLERKIAHHFERIHGLIHQNNKDISSIKEPMAHVKALKYRKKQGIGEIHPSTQMTKSNIMRRKSRTIPKWKYSTVKPETKEKIVVTERLPVLLEKSIPKSVQDSGITEPYKKRQHVGKIVTEKGTIAKKAVIEEKETPWKKTTEKNRQHVGKIVTEKGTIAKKAVIEEKETPWKKTTEKNRQHVGKIVTEKGTIAKKAIIKEKETAWKKATEMEDEKVVSLEIESDKQSKMVLTSPTSLEKEKFDTTVGIFSHLLSDSQQKLIRESLHDKISNEELKAIAKNVVIWVVSTVTSILYPAITMYEERIKAEGLTVPYDSLAEETNKIIGIVPSQKADAVLKHKKKSRETKLLISDSSKKIKELESLQDYKDNEFLQAKTHKKKSSVTKLVISDSSEKIKELESLQDYKDNEFLQAKKQKITSSGIKLVISDSSEKIKELESLQDYKDNELLQAKKQKITSSGTKLVISDSSEKIKELESLQDYKDNEFLQAKKQKITSSGTKLVISDSSEKIKELESLQDYKDNEFLQAKKQKITSSGIKLVISDSSEKIKELESLQDYKDNEFLQAKKQKITSSGIKLVISDSSEKIKELESLQDYKDNELLQAKKQKKPSSEIKLVISDSSEKIKELESLQDYKDNELLLAKKQKKSSSEIKLVISDSSEKMKELESLQDYKDKEFLQAKIPSSIKIVTDMETTKDQVVKQDSIVQKHSSLLLKAEKKLYAPTDAPELQSDIHTEQFATEKSGSSLVTKESSHARFSPPLQDLKEHFAIADQTTLIEEDTYQIQKVFQDLKFYLTGISEEIIEIVFDKITSDLISSVDDSGATLQGYVTGRALEEKEQFYDITEKSAIAHFISKLEVISAASDIVENMLDKLQLVAIEKCIDQISEEDLDIEDKSANITPYKTFLSTLPKESLYKTTIPLPLESVLEISDEIVQLILIRLEAFSSSKQKLLFETETVEEASLSIISSPTQICDTRFNKYSEMSEKNKSSDVVTSLNSELPSVFLKEEIHKAISKVSNAQSNVYLFIEEFISATLNVIVSELDQDINQETESEQNIASEESFLLYTFVKDVLDKLDNESQKDVSKITQYKSSKREETLSDYSHIQKVITPHKSPSKTSSEQTRGTRLKIEEVSVPGMVVYSEGESEEWETISSSKISPLREQKSIKTHFYRADSDTELKSCTFQTEYLSDKLKYMGKPLVNLQTANENCFVANILNSNDTVYSQNELCELFKVTECIVTKILLKILIEIQYPIPDNLHADRDAVEVKYNLNDSSVFHNELNTLNVLYSTDINSFSHYLLEYILKMLHMTSLHKKDNDSIVSNGSPIQDKQTVHITRDTKENDMTLKKNNLSETASASQEATITNMQNNQFESQSNGYSFLESNICGEIVQTISAKLESFINLKFKSYLRGGDHINIDTFQWLVPELQLDLYMQAKELVNGLLHAFRNYINQQEDHWKVSSRENSISDDKVLHEDRILTSELIYYLLHFISHDKYDKNPFTWDHFQSKSSVLHKCFSEECTLHNLFKNTEIYYMQETKSKILEAVANILNKVFKQIMKSVEQSSLEFISQKSTQPCFKCADSQFCTTTILFLQSEIPFFASCIVKDIIKSLCAAVMNAKGKIQESMSLVTSQDAAKDYLESEITTIHFSFPELTEITEYVLMDVLEKLMGFACLMLKVMHPSFKNTLEEICFPIIYSQENVQLHTTKIKKDGSNACKATTQPKAKLYMYSNELSQSIFKVIQNKLKKDAQNVISPVLSLSEEKVAIKYIIDSVSDREFLNEGHSALQSKMVTYDRSVLLSTLKMETNIQINILEKLFRRIEAEIKDPRKSEIIDIVKNVLSTFFRDMLIDLLLLPLPLTHPSMVSKSYKQLLSEAFLKLNDEPESLVSESEVNIVADDIINMLFQKIYSAMLVDIAVKEGEEKYLKSTKRDSFDYLTHSTSKERISPVKYDMVEDIVNTVLTKLEGFAIFKMESLFCPEFVNLNKAGDEVIQRKDALLESKANVRRSYSCFPTSEIETKEPTLILKNAKLESYAKEVADSILQAAETKLHRQVQHMLFTPRILSFHENVTASHIINVILDSLEGTCQYGEKESNTFLIKNRSEKELYYADDIVSSAIKDALFLPPPKDILSQEDSSELNINVSERISIEKIHEKLPKPTKQIQLSPEPTFRTVNEIPKENCIDMMLKKKRLSKKERSMLHIAVENVTNAIFKKIVANVDVLPSFLLHSQDDISTSKIKNVISVCKTLTKLNKMSLTEILTSESDITAVANNMIDTVLQKLNYAVNMDISTEKYVDPVLSEEQTRGKMHTSSKKETMLALPLLQRAVHNKLQDHIFFNNFTSRIHAISATALSGTKNKEVWPKRWYPKVEDFSVAAEDLISCIISKLESFAVIKLETLLDLKPQNRRVKSKKQKMAKMHKSKQPVELMDCHQLSITRNKLKAAVSSLKISQYKEIKRYAAEVAKIAVQIIKAKLDKETHNIVSWVNNSLFFEHITATEVVHTVLKAVSSKHLNKTFTFIDSTKRNVMPTSGINTETTALLPKTSNKQLNSSFMAFDTKQRQMICFADQQLQHKLQDFFQQESVLEKILRKKAEYRGQLEFQIGKSIENVLNEMFQRVMMDSDPCRLREYTSGYETMPEFNKEFISITVISKSDATLIAHDMIKIVLENVCSAILAGVQAKESTSVQKSLSITEKPVRAFRKSEMATHVFVAEINAAAERIIKNVLIRLESFVTLKLDFADIPEGVLAKESPFIISSKEKMRPFSSAHFIPSPLKEPNIQIKIYKPFSEEDKAISTIHLSQTILNIYTEKLASAILRVIKSDLDQEMQNIYSGENISLEQNVIASKIVNNILDIVSDEKFSKCSIITRIGPNETDYEKTRTAHKAETIIKRSVLRSSTGISEKSSDISDKSQLLNTVEEVLNEVHKRIMMDLEHLPLSLPCFNKETIHLSSEVQISEYELKYSEKTPLIISKSDVNFVANDIVETVLAKVSHAINENMFTNNKSSAVSNTENNMTTQFSSSKSRIKYGRKEDMAFFLQPTNNCCYSNNQNARTTAELYLVPHTIMSDSSVQYSLLSHELVQTVLTKIASFATTKLELASRSKSPSKEALASEMLSSNCQPKFKMHSVTSAFQMLSDNGSYGSGTIGEMNAANVKTYNPLLVPPGVSATQDYESLLAQVNLSKSELEFYAKDIISSILGIVRKEIHREEFQTTVLSIDTLPCGEVIKVNYIVDAILDYLYVEDSSNSNLQSPQMLNVSTHIQNAHCQKIGSNADKIFSVSKDRILNKANVSYSHYKAKHYPNFKTGFKLNPIPRNAKILGNGPVDYDLYSKKITRSHSKTTPKNPKEFEDKRQFLQKSVDGQNSVPGEKVKSAIIQLTEKVVNEINLNIKALGQSVSLLSHFRDGSFQGIGEKLFQNCLQPSAEFVCDPNLTFHLEVRFVASEIVQTVLEKLYICFHSTLPLLSVKENVDTVKQHTPDRVASGTLQSYKEDADSSSPLGSSSVTKLICNNFNNNRTKEHRTTSESNAINVTVSSSTSTFTDLHLYNINNSAKNEHFNIDKIADDTIECVFEKLQSFLSLHPNPISKDNMPGKTSVPFKCNTDHLQPSSENLENSKLRCYARNAVTNILKMMKQNIDKDINQGKGNILEEEIISQYIVAKMLKRCSPSLTRFTYDIKENSTTESAAFISRADFNVSDKEIQIKSNSNQLKTNILKNKWSFNVKKDIASIHVPGMIIYSDEEMEVKRKTARQLNKHPKSSIILNPSPDIAMHTVTSPRYHLHASIEPKLGSLKQNCAPIYTKENGRHLKQSLKEHNIVSEKLTPVHRLLKCNVLPHSVALTKLTSRSSLGYVHNMTTSKTRFDHISKQISETEMSAEEESIKQLYSSSECMPSMVEDLKLDTYAAQNLTKHNFENVCYQPLSSHTYINDALPSKCIEFLEWDKQPKIEMNTKSDSFIIRQPSSRNYMHNISTTLPIFNGNQECIYHNNTEANINLQGEKESEAITQIRPYTADVEKKLSSQKHLHYQNLKKAAIKQDYVDIPGAAIYPEKINNKVVGPTCSLSYIDDMHSTNPRSDCCQQTVGSNSTVKTVIKRKGQSTEIDISEDSFVFSPLRFHNYPTSNIATQYQLNSLTPSPLCIEHNLLTNSNNSNSENDCLAFGALHKGIKPQELITSESRIFNSTKQKHDAMSHNIKLSTQYQNISDKSVELNLNKHDYINHATQVWSDKHLADALLVPINKINPIEKYKDVDGLFLNQPPIGFVNQECFINGTPVSRFAIATKSEKSKPVLLDNLIVKLLKTDCKLKTAKDTCSSSNSSNSSELSCRRYISDQSFDFPNLGFAKHAHDSQRISPTVTSCKKVTMHKEKSTSDSASLISRLSMLHQFPSPNTKSYLGTFKPRNLLHKSETLVKSDISPPNLNTPSNYNASYANNITSNLNFNFIKQDVLCKEVSRDTIYNKEITSADLHSRKLIELDSNCNSGNVELASPDALNVSVLHSRRYINSLDSRRSFIHDMSSSVDSLEYDELDSNVKDLSKSDVFSQEKNKKQALYKHNSSFSPLLMISNLDSSKSDTLTPRLTSPRHYINTMFPYEHEEKHGVQRTIDRLVVSPLKINLTAESIVDTVVSTFENFEKQLSLNGRKNSNCNSSISPVEYLQITQLHPSKMQLLAKYIINAVVKELKFVKATESHEENHSNAFDQSYEVLKTDSYMSQENSVYTDSPFDLNTSDEDITQYGKIISNSVISQIFSTFLNKEESMYRKGSTNEHFATTEMNTVTLNPRKLLDSRFDKIDDSSEDISGKVFQTIFKILTNRHILQKNVEKVFPEQEERYIFSPYITLHDFDNVSQEMVAAVTDVLLISLHSSPLIAHFERIIETPEILQFKKDVELSFKMTSPCSINASFNGKEKCGRIKTTEIITNTVTEEQGHPRNIQSNQNNINKYCTNETESIKCSEYDTLINRVFNIILKSFSPDDLEIKDCLSFVLPEDEIKLQSSHKQICAFKEKGFSDSSIILLNAVSEKLVRKILEKCLFSQDFCSDNSPTQFASLISPNILSHDKSYIPEDINVSESEISRCKDEITLGETDSISSSSVSCQSVLDTCSLSLGKSIMDMLSSSLNPMPPSNISDITKVEHLESHIFVKSNSESHAKSTSPKILTPKNAEANVYSTSEMAQENKYLGRVEKKRKTVFERKQEVFTPLLGINYLTSPVQSPSNKTDRGSSASRKIVLQRKSKPVTIDSIPSDPLKVGKKHSCMPSKKNELKICNIGGNGNISEINLLDTHENSSKPLQSLASKPFSCVHICFLYNSSVEQIQSKLFSSIPIHSHIIPTDKGFSFNEKAKSLINRVMIEISKHQIRIEHCHKENQCLQILNKEAMEQIINLVWEKTLHQTGSHVGLYENITHVGLYENITDRNNTLAEMIAILVAAEISDYQLQQLLLNKKAAVSEQLFTDIVNNMSKACHEKQTSLIFQEIITKLMCTVFTSSSIESYLGSVNVSHMIENVRHFVKSVLAEVTSKVGVTCKINKQKCLGNYDIFENVVHSVHVKVLQVVGSDEDLLNNILAKNYWFSQHFSQILFEEVCNCNLHLYIRKQMYPTVYTQNEVDIIVERIFSSNGIISTKTPNSENACSWSVENVKKKTFDPEEPVLSNVIGEQFQHRLVYPCQFIEELMTGLLSKMFLFFFESATCVGNKDVSENETHELVTQLLDLICKELEGNNFFISSSVAKEQYDPQISKIVADEIINRVYIKVLKKSGSHLSFCKNIFEKKLLAETICHLIILETSKYQLQPCFSSQLSSFATLSFNKIAGSVLKNVKMLHNQSQESLSYVCIVPAIFLEEVTTRLLNKIISVPYSNVTCKGFSSSVSHFNKIHRKLVNAVKMAVSKFSIWITHIADNEWYLHPNNDSIAEQVVNSVYKDILQKYGCHLALQKYLTDGNPFLVETVAATLLTSLFSLQLQSFFQDSRIPASCQSAKLAFNDDATFQETTESAQNQLSATASSSSSSFCTNKFAEHFEDGKTNKFSWSTNRDLQTFWHDIVSGIVAKLFSYNNNNNMVKSVKDQNELAAELIDSILCKITDVQAKIEKQAEEMYLPINKDINEIVHSVFRNILQEYDANLDFLNIGTYNNIVAEQVSNLVMDEVRDHQLKRFLCGAISPDSNSCSGAENNGQNNHNGILQVIVNCNESATHASNQGSIFIEDIVTGVLLTFFPISTDYTTKAKYENLSESNLNEVLAHLKGKVMETVEQRRIDIDYISKNQFISKEITNIVYSICSNILRKYENKRIAQEHIKNKISTCMDVIVNIIIEELTSYKYQSQSCMCEELSSTSSAYVSSEFVCSKVKEHSSYTSKTEAIPSSFTASEIVEEIISELSPSVLSDSSSDYMYMQKRTSSEMELKDVVNNSVNSVLTEVSGSEVKQIHFAVDSKSVNRKCVDKIVDLDFSDNFSEFGSQKSANTDILDENNILSEKASRLVQTKVPDNQQLVFSRALSPYDNLSPQMDKEVQNHSIASEENLSPTVCTRMMSLTLVQDIITELLAKIFPPFPSFSKNIGIRSRLSDYDFKEIASTLTGKVVLEISKQNIWVTNDAGANKYFYSQNIVYIVNTIYDDIFQNYQTVQELREAVKATNNCFIDTLSNLLSSETFQYLSHPIGFGSLSSSSDSTNCFTDKSFSNGDISFENQQHSLTPDMVYSETFLENIICELLIKVFGTASGIAQNSYGFLRPDGEFMDIANKLTDLLLQKFTDSQIKVICHEEMSPAASKDDVEHIVNSVFRDLIEEFEYQSVDLLHESEIFGRRLAHLLLSRLYYCQTKPFSGEISYFSYSTLKKENIVQRVLNEVCKSNETAECNLMLSPSFLEDVIIIFLQKIFNSQSYVENAEYTNTITKTKLGEIVATLLNCLFIEVSNNQIMPETEEYEFKYVSPEERTHIIEVIADSVYCKALQEYGSYIELYWNLNSNSNTFHKRIATLLTREVYDYQLHKCCAGNLSKLLRNIDIERVTGKIFSNVPASLSSLVIISQEKTPVVEIEDKTLRIAKEEQFPTKIIPHIRNQPLKIDPSIISEHLAVISIKTESIKTLERQCLVHTGLSLEDIRAASVSGTNVPLGSSSPSSIIPGIETNTRKERRSTLDRSGRLDVRPREQLEYTSMSSLELQQDFQCGDVSQKSEDEGISSNMNRPSTKATMCFEQTIEPYKKKSEDA